MKLPGSQFCGQICARSWDESFGGAPWGRESRRTLGVIKVKDGNKAKTLAIGPEFMEGTRCLQR